MFFSLLALLLITYGLFLVFRPYILSKKYVKKGFYRIHNPLVGLYAEQEKNFKLHKDSVYHLKALARGPKTYRGIISNFGSRTHLMLTDPALMKEFLGKQDLYIKPDELYGVFKEFVGDGIVFLNGKQWKTHRKLVSMAFHYELLKENIRDIAHITQEFMDIIKKGDMKNVNILNEFQAITGETVGRLFFGENFGEYKIRGKRMTDILNELNVLSGNITKSPLYLIFGNNLLKLKLFKEHKDMYDLRDGLSNFALDVISKKSREFEQNTRKPGRKNLLDSFFEQRRANPQECFTDREILSEFITFFSAGMDTTGHLVTSMTYYLISNPQYKEKLMSEIDQFCPSAQEANIDSLNKMEFMTAFIKETLRLMPPGPYIFDRRAIVDHKLGDLEVKKGDLVNISIISNNFSANYHENPEKFYPERWIDTESLTYKSIANEGSLFVPFSMGNRNCIGQHMAMNEARVIFSLFLKNFEFELSDKNFKGDQLIFTFLYEFAQDFKIDLKAKF